MAKITAQDAHERSHSNSSKASEIARHLALAGIAVVWVNRPQSGALPETLVLPLALLCITMLLDLGQYVFLYAFWQRKFRRHEHDKEKFRVSKLPINFAHGIFATKLLGLLWAYALLLKHFFHLLF